jgi:hypothetical protein
MPPAAVGCKHDGCNICMDFEKKAIKKTKAR